MSDTEILVTIVALIFGAVLVCFGVLYHCHLTLPRTAKPEDVRGHEEDLPAGERSQRLV